MLTILVIVLILAFLGLLPAWGVQGYGWGPSGIIGLVLAILLVLFLLGRI